MAIKRINPRKAFEQNGIRKKPDAYAELGTYENLAAAIVLQAKQDAERLKGRECARLENQWVMASELIHFFESSWCQTLLGSTTLSSKEIREKVGI